MRHDALLALGLLGMTSTLGLVLTGCTGDGRATSQEYAPQMRLIQWTNADWQTVLAQVVSDDGLVRYEALQSNAGGAKDALVRYIGMISQVSPANRPDLFPTEADRLAYYLNAYNALSLYGVLQKGLPSNVLLSGLFATARFPVGGVPTTLDALEKQHVHPFDDPRTHFALNGMTRSSPPLRKEPYEGTRLDDQMDDQGRRFLNDPRGVQKVSDRRVRLSEIFTHFYPTDFRDAFAYDTGQRNPGLLESIRPFAGPGSPVQTATEYESMPFDWSLNRAD